MKPTRTFLASNLSLALLFFLVSSAWGQIELGDFTIRGSGEIGALPRGKSGDTGKFEEYRDLPESVIVPQLQLMIGSKKEDFYLNFEANKVGRDDQKYNLRFGRYGLLDIELEWDQVPHIFNVDNARTPYFGNDGNYFLLKKSTSVNAAPGTLGNPAVPANPPPGPQGTPSTAACSNSVFCQWLNDNAHPVDLKLFNGVGRVKLRYTPSPGWTFTGMYWSNNNSGKRAFGTYVGTSPGTYAIQELPEPIDYQTQNVELGGEYAGKGWSLGLKYNASLFHNQNSTLNWDNAINLSGVGAACVDSRTYANLANGNINGTQWGTCRSRLDLYPNNQAHTITLTGTASLPLKTQFLSTVSYGWRLQDDSFVPFTSNRCYTSNPALVGTTDLTRCTTALAAMPTISSRNLDGDVRPLMVNATLVNNFFKDLNLKAYYRLYDLENRSKKFTLEQGFIVNDVGNPADAGAESRFLEYSKNAVGVEAAYNLTRWLTAKLGYGWETMHRVSWPVRQLRDSDEHSFGPTVDIKPTSSLLVRASYKHFWRQGKGYDDINDTANISRMFDQGARQRDKVGLFAQFTPMDTLNFYAGFDFINDRFEHSVIGLQNDINYSPSVGAIYAPLDWVRLFADYNWDSFVWRLDHMQRANTTQNPNDPATCDATCQQRQWTSRGREQVHTFSIGSDLDLIKNLLTFRTQYGFSFGKSEVHASGAGCLSGGGLPFPASGACIPATDYSPITNMWHELLMRLEYQVHKNIALNLGYYFNHYNTKDKGVDIMKLWMGDQDQWSITGNANLGRSIFLGDQLKGPYTAHVGFLSLKLKF